MFSQGDEVSEPQVLPLYEKHKKGNPIVDERGQDALFDSFLDKYGIDAETYASIHQQAGNYVIYDPGLKTVAPGIELLFGGKGLGGLKNIFTRQVNKGTGRFVGERLPGGIAGPPKPFREITEQVTELTPLGRNITVAASLPLVAGSATMPEDQEATEEEALIARNQDEVQAEIDLLTANNKKELENKQRKSEKTKIEKEIKSIEDVISAIQGFDTKKSEAYQEERSRKKRRNTDIFLEEMALSMAGTTNLADGLAIGAANAASKVGDADEVEELARLEANKRAAKLDKDNKISDQDWQDITKRYQESAKLLQKQSTLMGIVDELDLAAASGSVTGINGIIGRLVDDVAGFTGVGGDIVGAATKAVNQGKYLTAQSITEILQEGGKTVSDRDRDLIKDIMANFESWFMSKGEARDNLGRVRMNMQSAFNASQADLRAIKSKFGNQIPELSEYDEIYGVTNKSSALSEEEEISIADQEDLIQ
tara:strand:+ start:212 stop:1654 length:1443 start_codon:yes stop_codon:yes gene_type:complete